MREYLIEKIVDFIVKTVVYLVFGAILFLAIFLAYSLFSGIVSVIRWLFAPSELTIAIGLLLLCVVLAFLIVHFINKSEA